MTTTQRDGEPIARSFAFGPFLLIPERQLLLQGEAPVRIGGRALDLLIALVERPGEILSKDELLARAWPGVFVEEGNLKANIVTLRRALGDDLDAVKYIATVTGRGYRFVGTVASVVVSERTLTSAATTLRNHNLPVARTRIYGRADVIDAVHGELAEARLVTIVGTGGIGKTTLALAVAERALTSFADGVWLVDLAPTRAPELTPNSIATTLGFAVQSADALSTLCDHLREREMLLVLDNCEHVVDAAAACAARILSQCPGVTILATSREPMRVGGERVRRLSGLSAPPASSSPISAAEALTFPAIQLFADRARESSERFVLTDADVPIVAGICRKLDGLALAIEFAATRIAVFGAAGLLKQLDDQLRVLGSYRGGPERQRTLIATLDWSYGLLGTGEAALLRAVSVFAGVFDINGASAIADVAHAEAAEIVAQLAAKSLLVVDVAAYGVAYRLLETTRTYCREHLLASGEEVAVHVRHAEYLCDALRRATDERSSRPAPEWSAAYAPFIDDLRAALAWAARDARHRALRVRLAAAGSLLWNHFSLTEECRSHVSEAVAELEAAGFAGSETEMQLQLTLAGATMFTRGLTPDVLQMLQRSLDLAYQVEDFDYQKRCLDLIGMYQLWVGENAAGKRTLETLVARLADDPEFRREVEPHLALAELFLGQLHLGRRRLEAHYRQDTHGPSESVRVIYDKNVDVGNVLSHALWLTGSPDAALRMSRNTIELAVETQHHISLSNSLAWACLVFFVTGSHEEGTRCVEMLDEQVTRYGIATWGPLARFYRGALGSAERGAAEGLGDMERALAELQATNHGARRSFYLAILADAYLRCGRLVEAESTIQSALKFAEAQAERWCMPEVQRVQAALLVARNRTQEAESILSSALTLAREIGALSWRLRVAADLARVWQSDSRTEEAHDLLASVYSEFSEGFSTRDLLDAAGSLATLAPATGVTRGA